MSFFYEKNSRTSIFRGSADFFGSHDFLVWGVWRGAVVEAKDTLTDVRKGDGDSIPSGEILSKERIMKYYEAINHQYGIETEVGIKTYIGDMPNRAS